MQLKFVLITLFRYCRNGLVSGDLFPGKILAMLKKVFISVLFFIITDSVTAQIKMAEKSDWYLVGQVKSLGTVIAKLEYSLNSDNDTTYFLLMKDFKKQREVNYFSIKFQGTGSACSQFYELLKSFFTDENKANKYYSQTFTLGKTGVNLQHCILIAKHGVRLTTTEGYINLSEKDIDKLFGKR